jgi:hypothetical protein
MSKIKVTPVLIFELTVTNFTYLEMDDWSAGFGVQFIDAHEAVWGMYEMKSLTWQRTVRHDVRITHVFIHLHHVKVSV